MQVQPFFLIGYKTKVLQGSGRKIEIDEGKLAIFKKKMLGQGHFGKAFEGTYDGKPCAIKVPHESMQAESEMFYKEVQIGIVASLTKEENNAVKLMGFSSNSKYIIMELYGVTLKDYMKNDLQGKPFDFAIKLALLCSFALKKLHEKGIVHLDVAARNFFMRDLYPYIGDFGLSEFVMNEMLSMLPSAGVAYPTFSSAPELLLQHKFGKCSDVYSYGILLWEILSGSDYHSFCIRQDAHKQAYRSSGNSVAFPPDYAQMFVESVSKGQRSPPINVKWPKEVQVLIRQCLDIDPVNRPTMEEVNSKLNTLLSDIENGNVSFVSCVVIAVP